MKKTIILGVLVGFLLFPSFAKAQEVTLSAEARQVLIASIKSQINQLMALLAEAIEKESGSTSDETDEEEVKPFSRFEVVEKASGDVIKEKYKLAKIRINADKTTLLGDSFKYEVAWANHHPGRSVSVNCADTIEAGDEGYCTFYATGGYSLNNYTIKNISIKGKNGSTYHMKDEITGTVNER